LDLGPPAAAAGGSARVSSLPPAGTACCAIAGPSALSCYLMHAGAVVVADVGRCFVRRRRGLDEVGVDVGDKTGGQRDRNSTCEGERSTGVTRGVERVYAHRTRATARRDTAAGGWIRWRLARFARTRGVCGWRWYGAPPTRQSATARDTSKPQPSWAQPAASLKFLLLLIRPPPPLACHPTNRSSPPSPLPRPQPQIPTPPAA
jgi:hypothetical protein